MGTAPNYCELHSYLVYELTCKRRHPLLKLAMSYSLISDKENAAMSNDTRRGKQGAVLVTQHVVTGQA